VSFDSTINVVGTEQVFASTADNTGIGMTNTNTSDFNKNQISGWIILTVTAITFFAVAYFLDRKK
jgi:hypothetical protein